VLELRLDFLQDFKPDTDLDRLMAACSLPYIITYRPKWEG
jgi:3-dehydroquinate dehydratase/shikimate dehydrogenase